MLDEIFDEEVEGGVVCRRDRTPHHCPALIRGPLVSQEMCIFE
jgi:hypothetical protein